MRKRSIVSYFKRALTKGSDRIFYRSNRRNLVEALTNMGLKKGDKVCVHSSLRRLGYVEGGADAVIDALMEIVSIEGSILMPSFSMSGSMQSYIESGAVFDVLKTPSRVGLISEVFRMRPQVLRSLHPTNSLSAWGNEAEGFVCDHDKSLTPFGWNTPYGRLAECDNSYILMLETHIQSLLHHLQERVDFPNLFLKEAKEVNVIDNLGKRKKMLTKVMRPKTPYFVAIPSVGEKCIDWALIQDFACTFPARREREIRQIGYRFEGYPRLYTRRKEFEEEGILCAMRFGRGEIGLLHIGKFLNKVEPEFKRLISEFRSYYDPDYIDSLGLKFH